MPLSFLAEVLKTNCSGKIFTFHQVKTKNFFVEEEDALGMLNDFHSRKTVTLLETLIEHHFFLLLWLFLCVFFAFIWHRSGKSNKQEKNMDENIAWAGKLENWPGIVTQLSHPLNRFPYV